MSAAGTTPSALPDLPADVDVIAEASSHPLGEAVTIIDGYVAVLQDLGGGTSPSVALRAIEGGADRVRRVTQDFLDLTRIAGRPAIYGPVSLEHALQQAIDDLAEDAQRLDVRPGTLADVRGDADQLTCVLRQLLRAAAAARGVDQQQVVVEVRTEAADAGRIALRVTDDARPSVEIGASVARGHGPLVGAGTASTIARRVAHAHGGTASTESLGNGQTVTTIDLPMAS
jgi:signal transduction histidine kinase